MPAKKTASKKRNPAKASRKKAVKRRPSARKKTAGKKPKVTKKKRSAKKAIARKKPAAKKTTSKKKEAKTKKDAKKSAAKRRASKKRAAKKPAAKKAASKKMVAKKKPAASKKKVAKKKPATRKKVSKKKAVSAKKAPGRKPAAARTPARRRVPIRSTAARRDLLSGPIHGIEPYVIQRGEEYMSPGQLAHFDTILGSWKSELMNEVDRTVHHMQDEAATFPDPNDRATQESEFWIELRTRDRERKLLRKINAALARIEDGSFGYCDETGEEIGLKRLEARPVATMSVEAQERREMSERQFRDRDDHYR